VSEGILIGSRLRPTINIGKLEPKSKGLQLLDQVNGKLYNIPLKINPDGTYSSDTPLMEVGEHKMMLLFDEIPVQEATVEVKKGTDVSKCRAYGPGLESAVVGEKAQFELDLDGAGEGALAMEMRGPAKAESRIQDKGNGKCSVEYITKAPGEYEMAIKFGKDEQKEHVKGSPFKAHVDYKKDPSQVIINGLDEVSYRLKQPINFIIDTSKTKDLPVTAHVAPEYAQNPPIVTKSPSNPRHYNVRFVPTGIANTSIPIQILYDGEKVGEKKVKVLPEVEPQLIKILYEKKKESLPITTFASHEGHVPFDVRECGNVKKIEACVFGPDGKERVSHVRSTEQAGIYDVSFPTDMAGEYCVVFYLNGEEVAMKVPVVAEKIGKKEDVLKDDVIFHPEVAENAPTTLTYQHPSETNKKKAKATPSIRVLAARPDAVRLEHIHEIIDNGHRVAERIMFTPTKLGKNTLNVFYGGEQVDHVEYEAIGQLEFERIQAERAKVVAEPEDDVDKYEKKYQFNIRDLGCQAKDLEAVVMPPAQKKEVAEIIDNHDGTILVKYIPKVHGSHELSILQNGAQLQGTPIKFYVDAYGDGWATVYGPGLQNAVVGEPATFTVCAKGSQAKELSVSIEGPAKSQIKIHDNKDGTCSAAWVPPVPGEYKVHVKLGGKAVRDSPFKVLVMGEGQKRSHLSVGSTSEVALPITQSELKGISASIKSPAGIEEPCFVRLLDGGRLGVSFTPRESGEHLITVKRDGKLVPKAPFKIKVDKSQVGDASKVEVTGAGKAKGITLQANELLVDTSKAGYGGLSVSVQGPSKAELTCKEVKAGLIKVLYTPTEPGVYAIAIKFADHHVKDSPLTVQCTGKSAGRVIQTIQKGVDQHGICLPDQESLLFLKLLNTSPMDITARLMDPKGHTDDIEMRDLGQQYYQLKFTPKLEGIHTLSVMYKDAHVNGSPFQFTVGSFSEGGAHKIRAAGQGVVRGETGTLNAFNIYHREAGAGALAVSVEGPSKATLEFKDHKDGNCHVDYKVATPGEYIVAVKFNDQHIPDSPFKVFVAPATGEVRKLELAQFHDQGIPSGKAFTFTVLTHRAKGHLEAKVVAPNNEVDTIDIVPIEDGESYAMRFVPKETGNHFIHVTLDGAPMRDSPFRLRVGGKDLCDPTAIFASGDGLVKGTTGQKCEFVINTANAGAGILTVQMDGPSKATLDAYELEKGYKVRYTPLAPGSYFASVKYNGIHAPGSPFKIPVEGKELGGNGYNETSHVKIDAVAKTSKGTVAVVPEYAGDAAKVTAKGAGLNKFFPGRPAAFQIDTGMAGQNLLMVGVVTTKGPCEEVVVRHQGQGHYVCSYRIPERVKGFVFIKYGDKEIPGSPFAIEP
ncbi:Protein CBG10541, partial [Caenorhabditis briggsae]